MDESALPCLSHFLIVLRSCIARIQLILCVPEILLHSEIARLDIKLFEP